MSYPTGPIPSWWAASPWPPYTFNERPRAGRPYGAPLAHVFFASGGWVAVCGHAHAKHGSPEQAADLLAKQEGPCSRLYYSKGVVPRWAQGVYYP